MAQTSTDAHRHVLASYLEKVFVVVVAVAAFGGLFRLGTFSDHQKFSITRPLLQELADSAGKMANDEQQTGIAKPLRDIADAFKAHPGKAELTRQELTAQIEHL